MDCSTSFGSIGCNGGSKQQAFKYIEKYGLEKASAYPYKGQDEKCEYDASKVVAHISSYSDVNPYDKEALMQAVAQQPVVVSVDANGYNWQFYSEGILDSECGTTLCHTVLLAGYDTAAPKPYWLVRNTWSSEWGMHGYIKIAMDVGGRDGECGILMNAAYPIL
jgi:KDEL-tailed cysteine endopeptidase